MSLRNKLYPTIIILLGALVLFSELLKWNPENGLRYTFFLVAALVASRLQVTLSSVNGTVSPLFFFVLFGVLEFTLPETLFMGVSATVIQYLYDRRQRTDPVRILFNAACMALAIAATNYACRAHPFRAQNLEIVLTLTLAATVFFTMTTVPMASIVSLSERRSLLRVWHDSYFWSFPYYLVGAILAGITSYAGRTFGWQSALVIIPISYLIYRSYNLYLGRMETEKKHAQEMASLHLRTIEALALAIEAKDHTTHDHLKRVQVYAIEVAKELGLSDAELEALRAASLLHDIGKLAVPEHIISKPGRLTREEFEKMKIHPVVGAEILERVQFPYPVTPIVRAHHERWNGSGYPDGLKGEEIPIGARILAAVDCLDALASDRQYRRALPLEEAMKRVAAEANVSFDPKVVNVLERRFQELERMARSKEVERTRLSTNVRVERGEAPAAGFETHKATSTGTAHQVNFLASIAAARQEVQNLYELTQDLGNSLSLNETLSLLSIRLKRMIPYDALAIWVLRDDVLRPEYVTGENFRLFSSLEIPLGQGLSGWVAENRKPIINGNPSVEPGYMNDATRITTMRSALSVPLVGLNGPVSVLTLYHTERDAFTRDHLRILMAVASKLALAVENALRYQQAESSAATDYMTGLPNARSLFLHLDAEISRCRRQESPLVVLVCDLNGFKQVNDRFGHLEGNRILRTMATKFKECCREYDYVARMGGDEFVLVMPGIRLDSLAPTLQRLRAAAAEAGREVCKEDILSLSIGHSFYPEDGSDAEQLLSEADRRMYGAKQQEKLKTAERRGYDFDPQPAITQW
ncbi:MAG: diguanylate cyclase [Bryobacteraceae bacterium]|jgi:diguanylate cyclase (GGDEF)-like protein/putative nucleotidyltransferase with HDIG domain